MPLTTVQRLLSRSANLPVLNAEALLAFLKVKIRIVPNGKPLARPSTGRRHGKRQPLHR